MQQKRKDGKVE